MENISNSSTAQDSRTSRVSASNVIYRGIIIFLLFFIVAVSLLFVGVFKKLSYIPEDVADVVLESLICQNCNTQNEEETEEEETKPVGSSSVLVSDALTLYQYPDLNFSVTLPEYIYFNSQLEEHSFSYAYIWDIQSIDFESTNDKQVLIDSYSRKILPDLLNVLEISFKPRDPFSEEILRKLACSGDCMNLSYITIKFFDNPNLNLEEVDNKIFTDYCNSEDSRYESEITTFNDLQALEYKCEEPMHVEHGTVLITDIHIVEIAYEHLSDYDEPENQVEMVFDSMKFE